MVSACGVCGCWRLALRRDRLAIEPLRIEPAAVGEIEDELGVALQRAAAG